MLPVDRTSVIARLMSGIFIAALLAACAAPPAAPVAPAATLIPPTASPDPTDAVKAWIDAINNSDLDAAMALMTEDARFSGEFTDPPPNVLSWFIGGEFTYGTPECEAQGDLQVCTFTFHDGCSSAYSASSDLTVKMTFAFQDDKIRSVVVQGDEGDWTGYYTWLGEMLSWASANRADEMAKVDFQHQSKGSDVVVGLCQEYAAAQVQDSTAVVQAWIDAINNGDLDAALALMTPDAEIPGWGSAPARNVLDWWIDIKSRYGAPDCQEADDRLVCNYTMNDDGCITAFGNTAGLPLRYTFDMQDGKIQRVSGVETSDADWSSYAKWSEEMEAWAKAIRAEEWAKIDLTTFSEGGEIIVKLCQEYASVTSTPTLEIPATVQAWVDAINNGDPEAAVAIFADTVQYDGGAIFGTAYSADALRNLFGHYAGTETKFQITDCRPTPNDRVFCELTGVDGCIAAFGATQGLGIQMSFALQSDGRISHVYGAMVGDEWNRYEEWWEIADPWLRANRPEEYSSLATEPDGMKAGTMQVKLCQEFAETLK